MSEYADIAFFIGVVFLAATSGGIFTPGDWYRDLNKPWWTPPDWVFPVVWTVLYVMIAIAGTLAWRAEGMGPAVFAWIVQIVLNAAWSWLMFGRRQIGMALADAGGMLIAIAAFMVLIWPSSPPAALLFVPYLAWVSTAFMLNLQVLRMNPDLQQSPRS